ncbi:hypothetical protein SteCoe_3583 [Stentor coeruleus]|uniref:Protein kinase domain-containing protein n=1 Tax=Stentor coeruleus TaxID=5963 RepID=A0A1R2CWW2_9CILI|nr:hypothetical protein SteCoe_3583 [Stentor coeruleus]
MGEQLDEDFFNSFPELSPTMEYSLNRRFSRTNKVLAEGKFKTIYLGYDHDCGREVAWSRINITGLKLLEKEKLIEDFKFFGKLDHPSVLKLIFCWEDQDKNQIVTITELTTCTLKHYLRKKMRLIRLKVIKQWCKSILEGIKYFHARLIIHKNIKCDNIFIGASDGNIRVGVLGYITQKVEDQKYDLRCFAYSLIEMCTPLDLDYGKAALKYPPREMSMIENQTIKDFIYACFTEETADSLLLHRFFSADELVDNLPIKLVPIEDLYEVTFEEIQKASKFIIILKKNYESIARYEFNYYEDVPEQVADNLLSKYNVPSKYFADFLNAIEIELQKILDHETASKPPISNQTISKPPTNHETTPKPQTNPFSLTTEKISKKLKISINLGIQDLSNVNKFKIDISYDPDTDNPQALAEEIAWQLQLDTSEISTIAKLINDKIICSESETHSNYSVDLLDLTLEDNVPSRPCLNSTNEFSFNSENSSLRNSYEPKNIDLAKSRSLSPIDEDEKMCVKCRNINPVNTKQCQ